MDITRSFLSELGQAEPQTRKENTMVHKIITKRWRKKAVALMLAGTMVGSSLQGISYTNIAYAAETNTGDVYYDGTYTGKGTGYNGGTTILKVTVKGDKITAIEEVSNEDTPDYYQKAKTIISHILENNSTQVDTVSRATKSCEGIITAVEDALQQAQDKQEAGIFAGGKGTKEQPYEINTAKELLAFAESVDNGATYEGMYVALTADIDLAQNIWNPIGNDSGNDFNGTFLGQGYTISNLKVTGNYTTETNVGLFARLGLQATVDHVNLKKVNIAITGSETLRTGGIAGDSAYNKDKTNATTHSNINGCTVSGNISADTKGASLCFGGGIIGRQNSYETITNCGTDVDVTTISRGGNNSAYAGGICGASGNNTLQANCYSLGDNSAKSPLSTNFGGMAGGISAMYAGKQYNVYTTGNTSISSQSSSHKWIGALNGQITAKVKDGWAVYGYYNEGTVQQINGVTQSAILANGVPGTALKVGVSSETYAYDQEYMHSKEFATLLNQNIPTIENTLKNNDYTDVKLEKWVVDEETVVLSGKNYDDVTINAQNFAGGDGTKENPYLIANETQLRDFATSINEDIDYHGIYLALAADISLSSKTWNPIGGSDYTFEGTFDGQGYTVSGMTIGIKEAPVTLEDEKIYTGFFGVLGEHATVKNLHLTDISEYTEYAASSYMGTIAAYLYNGVIDNCSATGTISNTAEKGNNFAGGLVGSQYKGAIINSWSDVDIASTTKSGSIAEAGGLVALNNRGLVANCYTLGDVYGSANRKEEGMASISTLIGVNAGSLVNCYANGANMTDDYSYYVGTVSGWITGIGKTYRCYYNKDSEMTIGIQKPNPIPSVGTIVSSGVNEYGDTYTGGLVLENEGISATDMKSNVLVDKLNGYFKTFPMDISQWGLSDDALNTWTVDKQGNVVTQSNDSAKVTYVQPDIEVVPDQTITYVNGTYYGRDNEQEYIVKLEVTNGTIENADIVSGSTIGTEEILKSAVANQTVTGDSNLEKALAEAFNKAKLGDTKNYEAVNPSKFAGGNGSKENPYQIATEEQLRYLASSINKDVNYKGIYFVLTNDITLTQEWTPIGIAYNGGNAYPFSGQFDGQGHTIYNLSIGSKENPANLFTTGLFGFTNGSASNTEISYAVTIKNVHLANVSIYNTTENQNYCGTLLGNGQNGIILDNCSAQGQITAETFSSFNRVGGLVSSALRGTIINCRANVDVTGTTDTNRTYAGGLISLSNRTTVMNCYATGNITGASSQTNKTSVGGLIAQNGGVVINCYATGNVVSLVPTTDVGGLFGRTTGIAANENCYYNTDALQQSGNAVASQNVGSAVLVNGAYEENVVGLSANELKTVSFAAILSENRNSVTNILTNISAHLAEGDLVHNVFYKGQELLDWSVQGEIVTLTTKNITPTTKPIEPSETAIVKETPAVTKAPTNNVEHNNVPNVTTAPTSTIPESTQIAASPLATQEVTTTAPTIQPEITKQVDATNQPEVTKQPKVTKQPDITKQPNATEIPASPSVIVTAAPVITTFPTTTAPSGSNTGASTPNQDVIVENPDNLPSTGTTKTTQLKSGTTYEVKGYGYQLVSAKKATVKVVSVVNKKTKKIVVANTVIINGKKYKVVAIANKAFTGIKTIKTAIIGKNVTKIGKKAFYGAKNLSTVKIKGTAIKMVGSKAFSKTNKNLTFTFPKGTKKNYKKKFQ